jgi:hypothetical protein
MLALPSVVSNAPFVSATGEPEANETPALDPKYQLLNRPEFCAFAVKAKSEVKRRKKRALVGLKNREVKVSCMRTSLKYLQRCTNAVFRALPDLLPYLSFISHH